MNSAIGPGSICVLKHDILINGQLTFSEGEKVVVENVKEDLDRPEYRYVVYSQTLNQHFHLSDKDISVLKEAFSAPASTESMTAKRGMAVITKVLLIVAAIIVVGGIGTGMYYTLANTVFARKTVPSLIGLKEVEAEKKCEDAGLRFSSSYQPKKTHRTGNEVVSEQKPKSGKKGTSVSVVLEDRKMEAARKVAEKKLGEASSKLREAQALGIDTSDQNSMMKNAQDKFDNAQTPNDYVGPNPSSAFWSDLVIQECDSKKRGNTAPTATSPQLGPAQMLESGTWQSQGAGSTWYLQDGAIYYSVIKKVNGLGAGAYEVVNANQIRLVIFQDWGPDEDNWDPHNPATYPWKTTDVERLGSNRVRIMEPSVMGAGPLDFNKI